MLAGKLECHKHPMLFLDKSERLHFEPQLKADQQHLRDCLTHIQTPWFSRESADGRTDGRTDRQVDGCYQFQ